MHGKTLSAARVAIPGSLLSLLVLLPPLVLQAQPTPPWTGMTVQHPMRRMVMITPTMLQQPERYDVHLYERARSSRVILSLYDHTGIKISERAVDLPAATDRLSLDTFIDPVVHLAIGYYYYQVAPDPAPGSRPQADSLRFRNISDTHLPGASNFGGYAEFADVDGDSTLDIITGVTESTSFHQPRLLINDGTGHFVDQSDQYLPETQYGTLDVTLTDVNKDTRTDLILANQALEITDAVGNIIGTFSGQNAVLVQTSAGRFVDETATRMPAIVNPSKLMKVADVNNDEAPDLYAVNLGGFIGSGVRHELYLNDGAGSFQEVSDQRLPVQALTNINDVEFQDLDGDGDVDMYIVNTILGDVARDFLNLNQDGFFSDASDGLPMLEDFGISTSSGDIDHDGDHDLFVSVTGGQAGVGGFDKLLENISPRATATEPAPSVYRRPLLSQNHPNPFSVSTRLSYTIPTPGFVVIRLFDARGKERQRLIQAYHPTGTYFFDFAAYQLPSGLYFYTLEVDDRMVETKKMVRIR